MASLWWHHGRVLVALIFALKPSIMPPFFRFTVKNKIYKLDQKARILNERPESR